MSTGLNCLVLFFDSTDKNRLKLKKRMGKKETPPHTRAHTRIRTERERAREIEREILISLSGLILQIYLVENFHPNYSLFLQDEKKQRLKN